MVRDSISFMTQELVLLIGQYGVLVVFGNVLLEQLGLPIPALPTLVIAGALAADGKLTAVELFLVGIVACAIADGAWYGAGRIYGNKVMKTLCRMSLTPDSCVSDTQARFERWGVNALVMAKFVPGLATIAPPLAGATQLGWARFFWFNTIGSALWVGTGLGAGLLFNTQIEQALTQLGNAGSWALGLVGTCLALYIAYKWWERHRFFAALRMARVSVDELYDLMDGGAEPVVVDVRSATARSVEPRQIPGSLHVPLDELDRHIARLPRDRDIIVYCTCPNEASAAQVAKLLMNHGFTRVRPLHGGLDAWIAAGYSFETLRIEAA